MSVVIASEQPRAVLDRCLGVIVPLCGGAEVVVVRGGAVPPAIVTRKSSNNVRFVPAPPGASAGEMRALGARAAAGDVVIFATEESAADAKFSSRLRAATSGSHAGSHAASQASAAAEGTSAERDKAIMAYLLAVRGLSASAPGGAEQPDAARGDSGAGVSSLAH